MEKESKFIISCFIRAIIVNFIILFIFLVLFEPTIKSDDYDMTIIAYGAVDGDYSIRNTYVSVFFTCIIRFLLQLVPTIAWYSVAQYIIIYISLFVISTIIYLISKKNKNRILELIILPFFAYELYIRITFTKTAGIAIASGMLLFLYLVEKQVKNVWVWISAFIIVAIGCSIRQPMLHLIMAVFFSSFIINLLAGEKENVKRTSALFILTVVVLLLLGKGIYIEDMIIKNLNEEWADFYVNNRARSQLQDYSMPDYYDYAGYYEEKGFSENDYLAWKKYAIYDDYDFFTPQKLKEIASIEPNHEKSNKYEGITKNILNYYLREPGFIIFLLMVLIFLVSDGKDMMGKIAIVVPIILCSLFTYAYMYSRGRLEHHVDVCVMFCVIILTLYYYCKYNCLLKKKYIAGIVVLLVILLQCQYVLISKASYYGLDIINQKDFYMKNKKIMNELSGDKEHVYVFDASTTNGLYCSVFEPFEIIPPKYYSNLTMTNRYYIPTWDGIAEEYGIRNYYKEATNSDSIYFVCFNSNTEWIEVLQTYINEHYCETSRYELVKKIDYVNIYRFVD